MAAHGAVYIPVFSSATASHTTRARAPAGNAGVRGDHAHVPPCSTTNTRHAHAKQSARWMPAGRPGGSGTQHAGALSGSAGRSCSTGSHAGGGELRPASEEMRDPPAHRAGQPAQLLPPALAASHRLPRSSCVRSEIDRRSPRVSTRRPQHDGSSPRLAVLAVLATGFKPEARRHTASVRDTSLRSRRRSAPRHCVGGSPFHGAIRPCAGSCSRVITWDAVCGLRSSTSGPLFFLGLPTQK